MQSYSHNLLDSCVIKHELGIPTVLSLFPSFIDLEDCKMEVDVSEADDVDSPSILVGSGIQGL